MGGMKLELRRCLKPGCPNKPFSVLETSQQRYCCQDHNPDPSGKLPALKAKLKRLTLDNKMKMINCARELLEQATPRELMVQVMNDRGFKTPLGQKITAKYLANFLYFNGFSKKRETR